MTLPMNGASGNCRFCCKGFGKDAKSLPVLRQNSIRLVFPYHVLAVLSDFTFVASGQAKFKSDGSIDTSYRLEHDESKQPMPQSVELGRQYIFHHHAPIDDELLAMHELPNKITKMGFKIINAPKSKSGLLYLYYGGPIFHIEFSDGKREFTIFNQLTTSHSNTWSIHDYVLARLR